MRHKDTERSYRIYGFTDRNNVDLEYFYKSPSSVILPNSDANVCLNILLIPKEFRIKLHIYLDFLECSETVL